MRRRKTMVLCAVFMATLTWIAYAKAGPSLLFLAILLLGCLLSMVAAWWIARQSLRDLEKSAPKSKERPTH